VRTSDSHPHHFSPPNGDKEFAGLYLFYQIPLPFAMKNNHTQEMNQKAERPPGNFPMAFPSSSSFFDFVTPWLEQK
jgi:hypothetical protein